MNDGEESYGAGPRHVRVILPIVVADDLKEGAPDLLVMGFGIRCDFVRRERSQKMVRSRDRAVEQQEPCSLKIREARDSVRETLLVAKALLQDALDKFRAADRRPENDEAVMRGLEITFPQWRCRPRFSSSNFAFFCEILMFFSGFRAKLQKRVMSVAFQSILRKRIRKLPKLNFI